MNSSGNKSVSRVQLGKQSQDSFHSMFQKVQLSPLKPSQQECTCKRSPIMVVDDMSFNCSTLSLIVKQKYKLVCDEAYNGKEAFEKFKENFLTALEPGCC